jgi:SagB-type dehydrogenase family enzyme
MKLPEPHYAGTVSIEEALSLRRSVRGYKNEPLTLAEVSQLLWAAQGITDGYGLRTAPSAGALYPLEVYLVAGNISGLSPGIYKYMPDGHRLIKISDGDVRGELARTALSQTFIADAPVSFIFTVVYERTTQKYGERGIRYVHMEAGHAAENLLLQGVALDIGAVTVGAFDDNQVAKLMKLPGDEAPLYIIPAGRK